VLSDGCVGLDARGDAEGRGAYVCSNVDCLTEAVRRDRVGRALRRTVDTDQLEGLKKELSVWRR
jgi:hypothetical protein